jgi:hypothetical protein
VQSPCDPLIKDHTEIFYIIYKWNVPSIQCKTTLWCSNSMREVDCQSLVFINFYVPALTPCLDCIKTTLQLFENIALLQLINSITGFYKACDRTTKKTRSKIPLLAVHCCVFIHPLLSNAVYHWPIKNKQFSYCCRNRPYCCIAYQRCLPCLPFRLYNFNILF